MLAALLRELAWQALPMAGGGGPLAAPLFGLAPHLASCKEPRAPGSSLQLLGCSWGAWGLGSRTAASSVITSCMGFVSFPLSLGSVQLLAEAPKKPAEI